MPRINISLLIAVHQETIKAHLEQTMHSVFAQKSIPNEIILIKDGPVTSDLKNFLLQLQREKKITSLLELKLNSGLASALNLGIKNAKYDFIARLDPEDEVINDRFAVQLDFFKSNPKTVILGSFAEEQYLNKTSLIKRPILHYEIVDYLKRGNPIIHSSVMFRKTEIAQIGGYPIIRKCQDLFLWVKSHENKYFFANIGLPLIRTKLNLNLLSRRNLNYFSYEKIIYKYQLQNKLISMNNFLLLTASRFILRSLPIFIKKFFYIYR